MFRRKSYSKKKRAFKKRRYGYKKTSYPKTRYFRTLKSRNVLTNIVDTVVRRTSELKTHEYTNIYNFPVALTWNSTLLSLVPQGSTSITRTGDRFRATSLSLNMSVYEPNPALIAGAMGFVRIIVFQWKPLLSAVLSASQLMGDIVEYDSHYNMENRQMYKVLWDKCVPVVGTQDSARNYFNTTLYFNGPDANLQCQAGTTNATNHIGILSIASHAGAACTCLFRLNSLLRFTDS